MEYLTSIFFAGFLGGAIRGLVGYVKYQTRFKNVKFKLNYFLGMTSLSAGLGLLAAWTARDIGITFLNLPSITPSMSIIIGYAGGDFLENIFKILTKKEDFFSFKNFGN